MDKATFASETQAAGFGALRSREMPANQINEMHTHDFAAKLLIIDGEISVKTEDGKTTTCRAGDTFSLDVGVPHEEHVGPEGVRYLAAIK